MRVECGQRVERGIATKNRFDVKNRLAAKTNVVTKRQLAHKQSSPTRTICRQCILVIAGTVTACILPFLLEPGRPS